MGNDRIDKLEGKCKNYEIILSIITNELGIPIVSNPGEELPMITPSNKLCFLPRIEKIEEILKVNDYEKTYIKKEVKNK